MTTDRFGFVFPTAGQSGYEGPNNPSAEFFTGREPSEAVARECIQNSLDAKRADADAVRVVFELRPVRVDALPGILTLRRAAKAAMQLAGDLQGAESLHQTQQFSQQEHISMLSVSDFGTTGLTGSEKISDEKSALSILTRGTGASSSNGDRGGSFGIGSEVGVMASRMSTTYYRTLRPNDPDLVIAGYARLATHVGVDGDRHRGVGFLNLLSDTQDFTYMRNEPRFQEFPARTEVGTDVLIPAYMDADLDPLLHKVRDAVASNFFAAIARGRLVVEGVTAGGSWRLDADQLPLVLSSVPHLHDWVLPFYRALQDVNPSILVDPDLGRVELRLFEDDAMGRSLGTMTMRKPLMRIDLFHHRIPSSYAAVLICADQKGNDLLRKIEPPEHTKWNDRGPRSNGPVVKRLKAFVRDELRARLRVDSTTGATVRGLEKFLPKVSPPSTTAGGGGRPGLDDHGQSEESARRLGLDETPYVLDPASLKPFKVSVLRPAISSPDASDPVAKGKDSGGQGGRRSKPGGGMPGTGLEGEGTSRIHAGDVSFRSFSPANSAINVLVLHPRVDAQGDLPLVALGAEGRAEDNDLNIVEAFLLDGNDRRKLTVDGLVIKDLALIAGARNTIQIRFNTGRAYRLGVKHG